MFNQKSIIIMTKAYLTSRRGFIDSITVYRYDYLDWVLADAIKKEKLNIWLKKRSGFLLYSIEDTCFYTLEKLPERQDKQYRISKSKKISAPYANTQQISNYIGKLIRNELSKSYKQYLNQNVFEIESINLEPFRLAKAVEFNIELFSTGYYLIHFSPTTKIVSSKPAIDKEYIRFLKNSNQNNSRTSEMVFSLVNTDNFHRKQVDLLDRELKTEIDKLLTDGSSFTATFDYHFIANYSPDLFGKVTENTLKEIKKTVWFLNPILERICLPDFLQLSPEKFLKVNLIELDNQQNLLVGCQSENISIHSKSNTQYGIRIEYTRDDIAPDELLVSYIKKEKEQLESIKLPITIKAKIEQRKDWKRPHITQFSINSKELYSKVNLQSASYYNGIYKTVNNWGVLPIVCNNLDISIFYELISAFNNGAPNFKVYPALHIPENDKIDKKQIQAIIRTERSKAMVALFCRYQMPRDFFDPIKNNRFQIYQGETSDNKQNRAKLSNFTCKCLEKMGGIVATIADTKMPPNTYFIGIDLGHTTVGDKKHSNLATVIFDNHGIFVGKYVVREIPRKENLATINCVMAFQELSKTLQRKNLPQPKQLVIHRDGKLHSTDIDSLVEAVFKVWGDIKLDIVEIIKSGFPIITVKDENMKAINPSSGSSYQDNEHKYAILVTNTQSDDNNTTIKPIVIKQKFGESDFNIIVDQVYWFTKIYTENLYNSTRLPATTLKANNIVGTSTKQHQPTYLG